jgi:hypothetical protein
MNKVRINFRQPRYECEAPRPERIKSWKSTICYDITKLWLEHQRKEDLTSRKEDLLGQVIDCCSQALWESQELRVQKIIVASLCLCAGSVMQVWFCWCPWHASGACRKTWANRNNCGKSRIPSRLHFFTFCTFGLMLRLRSAQVQKYQKIKAYQKWLKTGERFGRKKRRLLLHPSA